MIYAFLSQPASYILRTQLHPLPPSPPILYFPPSLHLKVSNRVLTRHYPRSHIPVLNKTRPDHPPDASDISLSERDTVASEVYGSERCAGQVGADEDALDVDGAAFELCCLERDDDCNAVLYGVGGRQMSCFF